MPKQRNKVEFIVATPADGGCWYNAKQATVSLINSHVARSKAGWKGRRRYRKSVGATRTRTMRSHTDTARYAADDAPIVGLPPATYQEGIDDPIGFSLSTLSQIFGSALLDNDTILGTVQDPEVLPRAGTGVVYDQSHPQQQHPACETSWTRGADILSTVTGIAPAMRSIAIRTLQPQGYASRALRGACQHVSTPFDTLKSTLRPGSMAPSQAAYAIPRLPVQVDLSGAFPFMSLAVDISPREQHLLQFFVKKGTKLMYGHTNSVFDPSMHMIREGAFQRSSVFLETHIVIADQLMSRLCGAPLSDNFYRRRAHAYRSVVDLISQGELAFGELLEGIVALQVAEFVVDRKDLMLFHLKAMDELVQSHGGLSCLLRGDVSVELGCYVTHFLTVEFPTFSTTAQSVMLDLVNSLRQIRAWSLRRQHDSNLASKARTRSILTSLRLYLQTGVDRHVGQPEAPFVLKSGYFLILFQLSATMAEWDFDLPTATMLLEIVQTNMVKSVRQQPAQNQFRRGLGQEEPQGPQPVFFAPLLPHISRHVIENSTSTSTLQAQGYRSLESALPAIEVAIAEACVSGLKAFAMINDSMKVALSRSLLQCCMLSAETEQVDCFDEELLAQLIMGAHGVHSIYGQCGRI